MEYKIYGTVGCGYCIQAKALLTSKEKNWTYIDLMDVNPEEQKLLQEIAGTTFRTVPQVFISDDEDLTYVGGYKELKELLGGSK